VSLRFAGGRCREYDSVVLACHADEALAMLGDASEDEEAALHCFAYSKNSATVHTDASFLPNREPARASWNYVTEDCRAQGGDLALTYYLNRLQSVWDGNDYCVTVNNRRAIRQESVIRELSYTHPSYSFRTLEGQECLTRLNGSRRTFYAGAYMGYGFHEDGVESAYKVAALLGCRR
jgi:predicted NAD/FAD-binding protein